MLPAQSLVSFQLQADERDGRYGFCLDPTDNDDDGTIKYRSTTATDAKKTLGWEWLLS